MSVRYVHQHLEDSPRLGPFTPTEWAAALAATVVGVLVIRFGGLPTSWNLCVVALLGFAVIAYKVLRENGEEQPLRRVTVWVRFARRPRRWRATATERDGYLVEPDDVDDAPAITVSEPPRKEELW